MPESIFSYNLTRKYPYPWFTWFVLAGGIAATVIFTVVNLAANGYELSVLYLTNPNATEHPLHPHWFQKKPWSWASKVGSTCQDESITIGSEFYTSNLGFSYKVTSVSRGASSQNKPAGSFSYHNDAIRDCNMTTIDVSNYADYRPQTGAAAQFDGEPGQVTATMVCTLYEEFDTVSIGLSTTFIFDALGVYDVQGYGPSGQYDAPTFLSLDSDTQASMWWGKAMIALYSYHVCLACITPWNSSENYSYNNSELRYDCGLWYSQLSASYVFPVWNSTLGSALLYDGMVLGYLTVANQSDYYANITDSVSDWSNSFGLDMTNDFDEYQNITNMYQALVMDGLIKSFYFTILTDLGQVAPVNILASATQVMTFLNRTVQLIERKFRIEAWEDTFRYGDYVNYYFLTNYKTYNTTVPEFYNQAQTGIPQAIPATISTQYLCQVPRLKSTSSLIVSIIIADLVFLQALWVTVKFLMAFFLERRSEAKYCDGCTKILASDHGEAIEMTPSIASTGNYTQVLDPEKVSFIVGPASGSARSGAMSVRTGSLSSVRRRNDANVQPLLASP